MSVKTQPATLVDLRRAKPGDVCVSHGPDCEVWVKERGGRWTWLSESGGTGHPGWWTVEELVYCWHVEVEARP